MWRPDEGCGVAQTSPGRRQRRYLEALWFLWYASTPRLPADVDDLVSELNAAYSTSSIGSLDQTDQFQELTYVDIDTFLANF